VLDAEGEVLCRLGSGAAQGIFRRQNFNRQQRRMGEDALPGHACAQDGEVGNAEMVGPGLDALLGEANYAPIGAPRNKDAAQKQLQKRMLELAQVALLDHPVDVLAVVLEDGREILLDADRLVENWLRCHGDSILRLQPFCQGSSGGAAILNGPRDRPSDEQRIGLLP